MIDFIYSCFDCAWEYKRDTIRYLCPICTTQQKKDEPLRDVLEVIFDYRAIQESFNTG